MTIDYKWRLWWWSLGPNIVADCQRELSKFGRTLLRHMFPYHHMAIILKVDFSCMHFPMEWSLVSKPRLRTALWGWIWGFSLSTILYSSLNNSLLFFAHIENVSSLTRTVLSDIASCFHAWLVKPSIWYKIMNNTAYTLVELIVRWQTAGCLYGKRLRCTVFFVHCFTSTYHSLGVHVAQRIIWFGTFTALQMEHMFAKFFTICLPVYMRHLIRHDLHPVGIQKRSAVSMVGVSRHKLDQKERPLACGRLARGTVVFSDIVVCQYLRPRVSDKRPCINATLLCKWALNPINKSILGVVRRISGAYRSWDFPLVDSCGPAWSYTVI